MSKRFYDKQINGASTELSGLIGRRGGALDSFDYAMFPLADGYICWGIVFAIEPNRIPLLYPIPHILYSFYLTTTFCSRKCASPCLSFEGQGWKCYLWIGKTFIIESLRRKHQKGWFALTWIPCKGKYRMSPIANSALFVESHCRGLL